MSRSGYAECDSFENWSHIKWRGRVASATRGQRGQAMLRELLAALDAMPNKRLIRDDLITEKGQVCAIGALLKERETPDAYSMHEDNGAIAEELDVAECLVMEIEWMNDDAHFDVTAEDRWSRMRAWVVGQIK